MAFWTQPEQIVLCRSAPVTRALVSSIPALALRAGVLFRMRRPVAYRAPTQNFWILLAWRITQRPLSEAFHISNDRFAHARGH